METATKSNADRMITSERKHMEAEEMISYEETDDDEDMPVIEDLDIFGDGAVIATPSVATRSNAMPETPVFHTPDGSTAEEYLRKRAYEGVPWRYPDGSFQDYERLEYELDVISSSLSLKYLCI